MTKKATFHKTYISTKKARSGALMLISSISNYYMCKVCAPQAEKASRVFGKTTPEFLELSEKATEVFGRSITNFTKPHQSFWAI